MTPDLGDRTRALLQAPLVPTMLRLAAPNVVSMVAVTLTIIFDGWIIGRLGPDALAGVALVFPFMMLMAQMSAGGLGAAITGAVARAIGGGDKARAELLALQSLWLALAFALVFALVFGLFGRPLFGLLGGRGAALDQALAYARVMFGGGITIWLCNVLAGSVRGSGQMNLAAAAYIGVALAHLGLCPLLVFGAAGWPGLGIAGAATSTVVLNGLAAALLLARLRGTAAPFRLPWQHWAVRQDVLRHLLAAGLPAMSSPLLSNAAIATATAWIGTLGTAALAGFGLAARLEYIIVPISFGFGAALTALVATNLGAGQSARALRATWTGAALVFVLTGGIGMAAALWPRGWMNLLADDPAVVAFGAEYLHVVGACYGFFGLGLVLFFASQGAGRLFWPLVGSVSRLLIVVAGGWLVHELWPGQAMALFAVVAAGYVAYATIIAVSILRGRWGQAAAQRAAVQRTRVADQPR